jgi:hypothetical protein
VVDRRPAALRPVGPRHGTLELGPEQLKVDHRFESFEVVALLRQTSKPILDVEHPDLPNHPILPATHAAVDQITGLSPRFLEVSNFAAMVEDIVGLYVDPPAHAVVLSIDEKSQIQALDRTQPGLPMKPGALAP